MREKYSPTTKNHNNKAGYCVRLENLIELYKQLRCFTNFNNNNYIGECVCVNVNNDIYNTYIVSQLTRLAQKHRELSHCNTSHNCAIAIDNVANCYRRINSCSRIFISICNFKCKMSEIIKRIGTIRLAASVCDLERTLLGGQSFR